MGGSSWSNDAYKHISRSYATASTDEVFKQNKAKKVAGDMDPKGVDIRESRDSDAHPESLAVMVWLDVTGSMGHIPDVMVREKLGPLMDTLVKHGLNDTHVFFGAIGDHISDEAPLQIGQFEAGAPELTHWLTSTWLEGGGGGGGTESYLLAWHFAAKHTSIDCYEKRGQKGILFTIGDEVSHSKVTSSYLRDILGYTQADDITAEDALAQAQETYHVFHIHVNEASYKDSPTVLGYWKKMLNERLIILEDHKHIAEVIAATTAMVHGVDLATITAGFDAKTKKSVETALARVDTSVAKKSSGVIKL